MAFAERLPSGKYRGGYWTTLADGTRKKIYVPGTWDRKKDAKDTADDEAAKSRRQANLTAGTLSANIHWGDWWDLIAAKREFESDTAAVEGYIVEAHLRKRWGDVPLNKIGDSDNSVQDWVDELTKRKSRKGQPYKPGYVRKIYGVFATSIHTAVHKKILGASPLADIKLPKVPRKQKPYTSIEENEQISAELRADTGAGPRDDYADADDFALETGLRPGELAGLHDDQVDVQRRKLRVRMVYLPGKKMMRDWTKDGDEREVPLTTRAIEIYQRRTAGRDMRQPCGIAHVGDAACKADLVFRTRDGRVLNVPALRRATERAAKRAGVAARSPYAWRRGFATRLREKGVNPFDLMELLGHENLAETHGYAQQGPDFDRNVRAALDDPQAAGLRVVGQPAQRGTDRGTDSPEQPSAADRNQGRRRTS